MAVPSFSKDAIDAAHFAVENDGQLDTKRVLLLATEFLPYVDAVAGMKQPPFPLCLPEPTGLAIEYAKQAIADGGQLSPDSTLWLAKDVVRMAREVRQLGWDVEDLLGLSLGEDEPLSGG